MRVFMANPSKQQALTPRQREIFEFVRDRILNRGYGPTVREIGQQFGIRSPNGVMCHLKALEKKGLIARKSHMSRAITLTDPSICRHSLPCLGVMSEGGVFRRTDETDGGIDFRDLFDGSGQAVVQVRGTTLVDQGILDGDFLIVRRGPIDRSTGFVVAVDQDDQLVLYPALADQSPSLPGGEILGMLLGVIRRPGGIRSQESGCNGRSAS